MEFLEFAKKRYSCRKFSDRKVEQNLIDRIIEAGTEAPTAVNHQPVRIWQMASEEAKQAIREVTGCHFGADNFLVVGCKKEESWTRPFDGQNFAEVDGAIVAAHMLLEIEDLGLNTTWVGYFDAPALKKRYPQMEDYKLIALFPIGYAAEDAEPSEKHFLRKSAEELSEQL